MATTYTVTATRLYVRQDDGTDKRYDYGQSVSGLSAEDVERFKNAGAIATPASDEAKAAKEAPVEPAPGEASDGAPSAPLPTGQTDPKASEVVPAAASAPVVTKPPRAGSTDAWREYAVASKQLTEAEAKKKSRDQLRDELN